MKKSLVKITAVLMTLIVMLTGCSFEEPNEGPQYVSGEIVEETPEYSYDSTEEKEYHLDDADELEEYKELVYENIIDSIECDDVFVEDVRVSYYSDEYIRDVLYNSKESIFLDIRSLTLMPDSKETDMHSRLAVMALHRFMSLRIMTSLPKI